MTKLAEIKMAEIKMAEIDMNGVRTLEDFLDRNFPGAKTLVLKLSTTAVGAERVDVLVACVVMALASASKLGLSPATVAGLVREIGDSTGDPAGSN